jgi:tRNA pseudouridine(38-40) synthase
MWLYKVAYVGWKFSGSQVQPRCGTVEGELQRVIGGRCRLMSRTDAAVSALGNVLVLDERVNLGKVNSQLDGVTLWAETEVERVPKVKHRHYRYFLVDYSGDPESLLRFRGTHDFSKFTRSRHDTVRTVDAKLGKSHGVPYVDFFSRGFLWNQVRRMVGGGVTAPPEPLVLMNIRFEQEPKWEEHGKWLKVFKRHYKQSITRSLALFSIGIYEP